MKSTARHKRTVRRDRPAQVWNKKGLPHRDWVDEGTWDSREDPTRDPDEIIRCEMCGKTGIRFVCFLSHPEYEGILRVGCKCAESMVLPSIKRAHKDSGWSEAPAVSDL